MAFGKRGVAPELRPMIVPLPAETSESERLEAFRDALLGLLATSGRITDAIREQGGVPMPAVAEEPDPEAGPLELKGFGDHFAYIRAKAIRHAVLSNSSEAGGAPDHTAQRELAALAGRMMDFNIYCQRAQLDEALAVALQSPHVPAMIDAIIAPLGFFAGVADNLVQASGGGARPDAETARANLDNHLLMAIDRMLVPGRLTELLPRSAEPQGGVGITFAEVAPHDGDYFVNNVYLPAELARSVVAARA